MQVYDSYSIAQINIVFLFSASQWCRVRSAVAETDGFGDEDAITPVYVVSILLIGFKIIYTILFSEARAESFQ